MADKTSRQWLKEHFSDPYVKRAQEEGFRSRAVYKLLEIQQKDHLFKPGMLVVDLGSAPGGWSQLVAKLLGPKGKVIALDILPMDSIPGVEFLQKDFTEAESVLALETLLSGKKVDWVISDMAPNMSGNESVDIPKAMYLAELALDFALQVLEPKGGFLIKLFHGEGYNSFVQQLKSCFKTVFVRKPKASRGRSREVYLVAKGCMRNKFTKNTDKRIA